MSTGWWALLGTVAVTLALGTLHRVREGRVRRKESAEVAVAEPEGLLEGLPEAVRAALGGGVTLVQLSSTFCAPCRHARVLLSDLAGRTEGLRHVEIDLTERPELARRLGVLRTPTTLALDAAGRELLRVSGVPRRDALLDALRPHLPG
ncbi:TlpA family protein disulfide reductase [Streptoalloteichus hindustanus]|uniref:Thioredoxin n=1 Tax=Streptoalloteichus hindustanus TaxID=2017 RepID=A0A1M4U7T5_STRHI|nr:thioredoxin family protein [Streptoalloteichus hindustanus]SHE52630.1 Thioredoxin [Streptoalloteichus hindustanus]